MSRWLSYADPELAPDSLTTLTIDNPDESSSTRGGRTVKVVKLSGGVSEIAPDEQEAVVVETIRAGNTRPGPVATATGLGATVSYQLIDRLIQQGRIQQAKDGALSVIEESGE